MYINNTLILCIIINPTWQEESQASDPQTWKALHYLIKNNLLYHDGTIYPTWQEGSPASDPQTWKAWTAWHHI